MFYTLLMPLPIFAFLLILMVPHLQIVLKYKWLKTLLHVLLYFCVPQVHGPRGREQGQQPGHQDHVHR